MLICASSIACQLALLGGPLAGSKVVLQKPGRLLRVALATTGGQLLEPWVLPLGVELG
ncbi:hypothetical protein [Candidatus Hakubella thermalkaliphila]|uniref:hypothetical protein n=1 Tax=Candidatus Hakubella thermalkaliphila TaxID=2754717 RepID=UPI001C612DA4|nr:hypothetical protein [Candidatus Hakubella thermalkaliphila]